MAVLVANNAAGALANAIADADGTLNLQAGQGALFPAPTGGDYFMATLVNASNQYEIVKCTARAGDALTITRAQEGTTARAFAAGDVIELRVTAALLNNKLDKDTGGAVDGPITATQFNGPLVGDVSGNAATATKLAMARTLSLSGDVTGSAPFDGSGNAAIAATVASATTVVAGKIRKATSAEAVAGTSDVGAITPDVLQAVADVLMPAGHVMATARPTAPTGWLECDGATISRTTYSRLFAAIGTTYGAGDGVTTFKLPDLRGEFVRGWDHGRGVDAARALGSAQADELKAHSHQVPLNINFAGGGMPAMEDGSASSTQNFATGTTGGAETRPRNVAMMYCIKT